MWAIDGREVSRLTKWIHPKPFSRMPAREFGRRRRVVEEEYIDHNSVSGSLHKEPSSTSTRTGSTSRSASTLRSGDPSEDSSFWLETFFSPSSSVSSSDDEGDGSTDDSSTFKRPPRPGEGDTSQPASSTRGDADEDDEELVYNDLEDDENQEETINVAEELRRVQAGVRHQYSGAYAKAIHEWQHWWAKNKHDRRRLIAPHERRFVADKENARKQILEYHEQKRREEEAAARRPLEQAIIDEVLRHRSVARSARLDLLTHRADHKKTTREQYIQLTHDCHLAAARPEHLRKKAADARARRMPLHSRFEASVKLDARDHDEMPLVLQEIRDTQALLTTVRRAGVVGAVNRPEKGEQPGEEEVAASQGLNTGTYLTLRPGDTTVRVHPKRGKSTKGGKAGEKGGAEKGGTEQRGAEKGGTEKGGAENANAVESTKEKSERLAALTHAFHVDLTRYRNVTVLRGDALLDRGVMLLGQALGYGMCEQIVTLHLQHNGVGRLGMESLAKAFASGGAPGLETLSLQKNNVTGRAVEALMGAAKKGGLPNLKRLDLRYNQCGDVGACALASALLAGSLPSLERALLQQNNIKDRGASALHMAILVNPTRFCPALQVLNIRQNSISVHCLRNMQPAPAALQY